MKRSREAVESSPEESKKPRLNESVTHVFDALLAAYYGLEALKNRRDEFVSTFVFESVARNIVPDEIWSDLQRFTSKEVFNLARKRVLQSDGAVFTGLGLAYYFADEDHTRYDRQDLLDQLIELPDNLFQQFNLNETTKCNLLSPLEWACKKYTGGNNDRSMRELHAYSTRLEFLYRILCLPKSAIQQLDFSGEQGFRIIGNLFSLMREQKCAKKMGVILPVFLSNLSREQLQIWLDYYKSKDEIAPVAVQLLFSIYCSRDKQASSGSKVSSEEIDDLLHQCLEIENAIVRNNCLYELSELTANMNIKVNIYLNISADSRDLFLSTRYTIANHALVVQPRDFNLCLQLLLVGLKSALQGFALEKSDDFARLIRVTIGTYMQTTRGTQNKTLIYNQTSLFEYLPILDVLRNRSLGDYTNPIETFINHLKELKKYEETHQAETSQQEQRIKDLEQQVASQQREIAALRAAQASHEPEEDKPANPAQRFFGSQ